MFLFFFKLLEFLEAKCAFQVCPDFCCIQGSQKITWLAHLERKRDFNNQLAEFWPDYMSIGLNSHKGSRFSKLSVVPLSTSYIILWFSWTKLLYLLTWRLKSSRMQVQSEYLQWVAQYMVMKRASIEPNFHQFTLTSWMPWTPCQILEEKLLKRPSENIKVWYELCEIKASASFWLMYRLNAKLALIMIMMIMDFI